MKDDTLRSLGCEQWTGKYVLATCAVPVLASGNILVGKLAQAEEGWLMLELDETCFMVNLKYVVMLSLPSNQDHLRIEAMGIMKKVVQEGA